MARKTSLPMTTVNKLYKLGLSTDFIGELLKRPSTTIYGALRKEGFNRIPCRYTQIDLILKELSSATADKLFAKIINDPKPGHVLIAEAIEVAYGSQSTEP